MTSTQPHSDTLVRTPALPAADSLHALRRSDPEAAGHARPDSMAHGDSARLLSADSLRFGEADSLRFGVDSLRCDSLLRDCPDSLLFAGFGAADTLPAPAPLFRPATPKEVFGPATIAVVPVPSFHSELPRPLTGNSVYEGLVLLLAAAYAILFYRHISDIRLLFSRISHDRASGERLAEEPGSTSLSRFLKVSNIIGLLFIGIAAAKYAEALADPGLLPELPFEAAAGVPLLFALVWVLVALFQSLVLRSVGIVTLSQRFINRVWLLKRSYFALAAIVATPPLLLFALCPPYSGRGWFLVILGELAVTALLYLRESLHLFLSKKIPFLHWFLYLCAVEIFPFSLLILIAARYGETML